MSKELKARKIYPGVNQTDNEQVLENIRVTLAAHQRESVTPSPITVRETATPSPIPEMTSPGSVRSKSKPPGQGNHKMQMAQIRNTLKPHHRSDPGFNLLPDQVNLEMLQGLIMNGYDEVCIYIYIYYYVI